MTEIQRFSKGILGIVLAFGILPFGLIAILVVCSSPEVVVWGKWVTSIVVSVVFITTTQRLLNWITSS